jgi:hypothetical protein
MAVHDRYGSKLGSGGVLELGPLYPLHDIDDGALELIACTDLHGNLLVLIWQIGGRKSVAGKNTLPLGSGKMCPNSPESSVDVVEETTMDLSCADANGASRDCEGNRERKRRATCPCESVHGTAISTYPT